MDDGSFARFAGQARSGCLSGCIARINERVEIDSAEYLVRESLPNCVSGSYYSLKKRKYAVPFPARTVLSAIAVVASVFYALACALAMYKRRVSRHFYTLIFNRVAADLLIAVNHLLFNILHMIKWSDWSSLVFAISAENQLLFLVIFSLLATAVTYVALLAIKLYGIARPLQMFGGVRLRTCVLIVVVRLVVQ